MLNHPFLLSAQVGSKVIHKKIGRYMANKCFWFIGFRKNRIGEFWRVDAELSNTGICFWEGRVNFPTHTLQRKEVCSVEAQGSLSQT